MPGPASQTDGSAVAAGWDCHVHVFSPQAPVAPGHYQPQTAALETIEALAGSCGLEHLVLVQPSVYGTDNSLMLQMLRRRPGRHRGVAVVDASVTSAELQAMHEAGVRGIRFNLVSPVGNGEAALDALAPQLRALGWHVQWYARAGDLARIAVLQERHGLRFVLDHYAGVPPGLAAHDSAWDALKKLANQGAWVKLSAPYRLPGQTSAAALQAHSEHLAGLFTRRVVWGSDWPHTSFAPGSQPDYAGLAVAAIAPGLLAQAAQLYA
jgi:predicted TIM-barrel fold metal-dependent hydrolase